MPQRMHPLNVATTEERQYCRVTAIDNRILPCVGCKREFKDKTKCCGVCSRLHAYQEGEPYLHIEEML